MTGNEFERLYAAKHALDLPQLEMAVKRYAHIAEDDSDGKCESPWSSLEELLVYRHQPPPLSREDDIVTHVSSFLRVFARYVAMALASTAMVVVTLRSRHSGLEGNADKTHAQISLV